MRDLSALLSLLRPYAGWLLLGILLSALTLLANVALMAISGWFIAAMALAGAAGTSMNYFTPAAMIRATAILRTGGRYLERLVTHEATLRLLAGLRVWFYNHLEPLAPAGLEGYHSGDLLSRIRADIDTLDHLYLRVLVPLAVALIGVLLLTLVMSRYDSALALLLLGFLLLAGGVIPALAAHAGQRPGSELVAHSARLRSTLVEGIQGMDELLVLGAAETHARGVAERSRRLIQTQGVLSRIAGWSQAGLLLCSQLALWSVLLLAIPLLREGLIEPAELAMLALFTLAAFEAVMPLPEAFRLLGQSLTAAARLFEIARRPAPVVEPEAGADRPADFRLLFDRVSLRYGESARPALADVDLQLGRGRRVAVAGPSGAGKSSLIPLLLRFRDPHSGGITLGGRSLSAYLGEDLRRWVGVVPQQVHLFNMSIRDNLLLADPGADEQRLLEVCRAALLDRFIEEQPEGLETWVGETGVLLSGGQARRLAIARALMRESDLLVLDEPGEGLDALTEQRLIAGLLDRLGECGLLLITHRLIALERMDEIIVLVDGRIEERGTFQELVQSGGWLSMAVQDRLPQGRLSGSPVRVACQDRLR